MRMIWIPLFVPQAPAWEGESRRGLQFYSVCMHMYIRMYIYACVCVHVSVCIDVSLLLAPAWEGESRRGLQFYSVCMHMYIRMYICVCVCVHVSVCINVSLLQAPAWEGESRRGLQFYALSAPADATLPVRAFWHAGLRQFTLHSGAAWSRDETERGVMFHAYPPSLARARLMRMPIEEREAAAATCLAAGARGVLGR